MTPPESSRTTVEGSLVVDLEVSFPRFAIRPRFQAADEVVVIFGPSGAGKSATLRTLAGLIRPRRGLVRLHGRTLYDSNAAIDLPPQQRRLGYVPQNYALFPHRSVAENIAFGLRGLPRTEVEARVRSWLGRMQLEAHADVRPSHLSGGQQQRAALARALAASPDLLLMDEPFAALEEGLREQLREVVRRLQAESRIPVILVTHNLAEAYSLADRLVVLSEGRVVQAAPPEEVFRRPASPLVAKMVGMTNLLATSVVSQEAGHLVVDWNGRLLRLNADAPRGPGAAAVIGIRPEEVMILRRYPPDSADAADNVMRARVAEDRPEGRDHILRMAVQSESGEASGDLWVRIPHPVFVRIGLRLGDDRAVAVRSSALHLFPPGSAEETKPPSL
jgi:molybdate transport system ATP-binding protein